jgi:hypothetical protein
MSWSQSYSTKAAFLVGCAFVASAEAALGEDSPEVLEQKRIAHTCAKAIVDSHAVGHPPEREFVVSLYGHANPKHAPTPGWANDCIGIAVTQATPPVPAPDPAPAAEPAPAAPSEPAAPATPIEQPPAAPAPTAKKPRKAAPKKAAPKRSAGR